MEFSNRTNYIVERLAVSIIDAVELFIDTKFESRNRYMLVIDDALNVSFIYDDEALELNMYDHKMLLDNFIEVEKYANTMSISVDIDKCDSLADKYAPLIEYGVVNAQKFL